MIKTAPGPRGAVCAHAPWWDQAGSAPRHDKGHAALCERVVNSKGGREGTAKHFLPNLAAGIQAKGAGQACNMHSSKAKGEREQQDRAELQRSWCINPELILSHVPTQSTQPLMDARSFSMSHTYLTSRLGAVG